MNQVFIINYIKKMQKHDIYKIAYNKGIILSDDEVNIIFDYIKKNYRHFFNGSINYDDIKNDAKKFLSSDNYKKFLSFYNQYMDKI